MPSNTDLVRDALQFDRNSDEIKKYYPKDTKRIKTLSRQQARAPQIYEQKQHVWQRYLQLTESPTKDLLVTTALIRFGIEIGLAISLGIVFSNAVLRGDDIAIFVFIPAMVIIIMTLWDWAQACVYMLRYDEKNIQPAAKASSMALRTDQLPPPRWRELSSVHSRSRPSIPPSRIPPEHLSAVDTKAEVIPNETVAQTENLSRVQDQNGTQPPEESDQTSTLQMSGPGLNSSINLTTRHPSIKSAEKRKSDSLSTAHSTSTVANSYDADIESQSVEGMRSIQKDSKTKVLSAVTQFFY